jgi:N-acetylglutamate synthase-like GNAT family acetyltransferase
VLACAALREYSPSLAELVSVATGARGARPRARRLVVAAVERLALGAGYASLFAHTLSPEFFEAIGLRAVGPRAVPEKRARPAHALRAARPRGGVRRRVAAAA